MLWGILYLFYLCLYVCSVPVLGSGAINGITPDNLANEQGFILQKYTIETEDGYLLSLWRFNDAIETLTRDELSSRSPVLAIHGILDTGTFPMYNSRNNSLAYLLFDAGYDVWSLSVRGTTYSTEHKTLSTDTDEYWDFSLSQIGRYDIPAAIDFIINNHSIHTSVFLLAHSMGTSSIQALLTSSKSWGFDVNKIRAVTMLAPAIYLEHCDTMVIGTLLKQSEKILQKELTKLFGTQGLLKHEGPLSELPDICYNKPGLCKDFLNGVAGTNPDSTSIDENRIYVYVNFYPAGSSVQAVSHLIEIVKRNEFSDYDYGTTENQRRYGTTSYPKFDSSQFPKEVPLFVVYGGHDVVVSQEDVERFISEMEDVNLNDFRKKIIDNYAHGDFIFGIYAKEDFIDDVIMFFDEYN